MREGTRKNAKLSARVLHVCVNLVFAPLRGQASA
jgi:hypothetical protein